MYLCGYFINIDGNASIYKYYTNTNCQLLSDIIIWTHTEIRFLLDPAQVSGVAHSSQAPCELHPKLWQTRLWPAQAEIGPPQIAKLVSHTRLSSIITYHFWWTFPGCLLHCYSVQAVIWLIFIYFHAISCCCWTALGIARCIAIFPHTWFQHAAVFRIHDLSSKHSSYSTVLPRHQGEKVWNALKLICANSPCLGLPTINHDINSS